MIISGFNKLTLSDYPGKTAAIVFTGGCNFNCSYCQNSSLINIHNEELISEEEIFGYLDKRKNVLDGVVISGGEPTIQKGLKEFIKKIKEKGFLVKLDTNGSNPQVLEDILKEDLIDYVAMDVKNIFTEYELVTKNKVNISNLEKSIRLLKNSNIDYEFRITIIKNYHDVNKLLEICDYLGGNVKIYIQNFEDSEGVRDKELKSFNKDELMEIQKLIGSKYSNVYVRNLL